MFDSLRPRRETEKRSLRSLRYRNGIPAISLETLSSVTQGKQRNAIVVTQTIIVLSIGEAYSWNKLISPSITRNASIAGILFADVTQSHARCSFIQSLKGNIFVIFLVKIKANHLDALGLPIFLRLNVVSKPTEQRKKKNLDDNLEAKNPEKEK